MISLCCMHYSTQDLHCVNHAARAAAVAATYAAASVVPRAKLCADRLFGSIPAPMSAARSSTQTSVPTDITSMLNEEVILDQTFQVFKANGSLPYTYFTPADSFRASVSQDAVASAEPQTGFALFLDNFAKFLYLYLRRTSPLVLDSWSELITSINSYIDLLNQLKVSSGGSVQENDHYEITYFSIRHASVRILPRQTMVFIKKRQREESGKDFNTVVLVKSPNAAMCEALLRIVECVDEAPYPLVIKPSRISQEYIVQAIDHLNRTNHVLVFGDIELTFDTAKLVGDNLRQIGVFIGQQDLDKIARVDGAGAGDVSLTDQLFAHLKVACSLNLRPLPLARIVTSIVNISQDGKIKIHRAIQNAAPVSYKADHNTLSERSLVWFLLVSLFPRH